jgi:Protein of unknown function (DUF418)
MMIRIAGNCVQAEPGLTVCVAQIIGSVLWLTRVCFGPLEWLWRSLTYGQRQPMSNQQLRLVELVPLGSEARSSYCRSFMSSQVT